MPADTTTPPAAETKAAEKKDTSTSKGKGSYYQHLAGKLTPIPVKVVARRKKGGTDLFDLARSDDEEPFVTDCEARDTPEEGFFVPA